MATRLGANGAGRFPATRYSAFDALRSADADVRARSLETLARAYWRPVYAHIRIKWRRPPEASEDLTQAFFARAVERRIFDSYDARKGRFRTFLQKCLDRFVSNDTKARRRIKRGGDSQIVPFDFELAETELAASVSPTEDAESVFDREWTAALLRMGIESLRSLCAERNKPIHFALFERLVLAEDDAKPSYAALAKEHRITVTDVTNYLAYARREFRRNVLVHLRAITATEEEFESEARALLGV